MNKNEYKDKVIELLKVDVQFIDGYMNKNDIDKCSFPGVYALFDKGNGLIYIGSAYADARYISDRLKQYLTKSKTGNTVANALVSSEKYPYINSNKEALETIKKLEFVAFKHKDIEYQLIAGIANLINKLGQKNNED